MSETEDDSGTHRAAIFLTALVLAKYLIFVVQSSVARMRKVNVCKGTDF